MSKSKEPISKVDKEPEKEVFYIPSRVMIKKNQVIGVKMAGDNSAVVNRVFKTNDVINDPETIHLLINNNAEFEDISPR